MSNYNHTEGKFTGKGGLEIYHQSWTVASPKAAVVIVHGVGEHSDRYMNLINKMAGKGLSFYALDHRGHGRSGGNRGHIDSMQDYIYDLKLFVTMVREEIKNIPVVMLGHSMGGAIACRYGIDHQKDIDFLILSAPGMIPGIPISKALFNVSTFLSKRIPKLSMSNRLDANKLSHDRSVVDEYLKDPLNHGRITPRWFTEFMGNADYCLEHANELKLPLLIIHGKADALVNYKGSEILFEKAESKDKDIALYEGLYHETMNEVDVDREEVLTKISNWIISHISGGRKVVAEKKPAAKKVAEKKPVAKKTAVKKAAVKKPAAKKVAEKKPVAKKTAVKKAAVKKPAAKKVVKKAAAKKTTKK